MKKIEMLQIKKDKNVLKTGSLCKVYKKSVGNKEKLSIYCKKHFHFLDLKYMERDTLLCYFAQKKEESNMRRWHYKMLKKTVAIVLSAAMVTGTINLQTTNTQAVDRSKPWLLSTNRPAYSSSVNGGDVASFATDGRLGTQWGAAADVADQWLDVDLGGKADISKVVIDWQNNASYGVAYQVLVSDDEVNWTKVYETKNGTGGDEKHVMRNDGSGIDYSYYEDVLSTDGADGYKLTQAKGRYVSAIKLKTDNDNDYILTTYLDNSTTDWKNVKADKTIHLKAGKYQMKLLLVDGGFNLNYVKIYKKGTKAPIALSDDVTKADLSEYPEISFNGAKVIDVTSEANDNGKASNVIDGNYDTRWESKAEDPQALTIELASEQKLGGMKIYWEGAAAKQYVVETFTDKVNWSTAFTQNRGKGGQGNGDENRSTGLEAISFDKVMTAKYVRITCTERLTGYGDSIYEIKLYGKGPDQKDKLDAPTAKAVLDKDEITVSWNAVANAANYMVYRTSPMNTNELMAIVNGTSYTDSALTENGNYTYWVVAVPADGSDDYTSSEYSVATEEITYTKTEQGGETDNPGDIVIDSKDLAAGKTATASSREGENVDAMYAVDGSANTRWSSEFTDNQWISVDLEKTYKVGKVVLTWEAAYGKDYNIQVSTDGNVTLRYCENVA